MWASGKVNPIITYKNKLDPEKQAITQELKMANYSQGTKYGSLWYKLKKKEKSSALVSWIICIYLCIVFNYLLTCYDYYRISFLFIKCVNELKSASDNMVSKPIKLESML